MRHSRLLFIAGLAVSGLLVLLGFGTPAAAAVRFQAGTGQLLVDDHAAARTAPGIATPHGLFRFSAEDPVHRGPRSAAQSTGVGRLVAAAAVGGASAADPAEPPALSVAPPPISNPALGPFSIGGTGGTHPGLLPSRYLARQVRITSAVGTGVVVLGLLSLYLMRRWDRRVVLAATRQSED